MFVKITYANNDNISIKKEIECKDKNLNKENKIEFSRYESSEMKSEVFCFKQDTDKLYCLTICEDGGGGSYSRDYYLFFFINYKDAISEAIDWFENEHDYENDCPRCKKNKNIKRCKSKFVKTLKKDNGAEITYTTTDSMYATIKLYNIDPM